MFCSKTLVFISLERYSLTMTHVLQKFKRDISGICWSAGALFLALALFSFDPTDPSFNTLGKEGAVSNFCGYFGSFLADMLYQAMGLTSWILVLAALRVGYFCFLGKEVRWLNFRYLWVGLLILTCSSLLSLYFPEAYFFQRQIPIGGLIGLASVNALVSAFNFYGVAVILWASSMVLLIFYTEKTLKDLFVWPRLIFFDLAENLSRLKPLSRVLYLLGAPFRQMARIRLPKLSLAGASSTTPSLPTRDPSEGNNPTEGLFQLKKPKASIGPIEEELEEADTEEDSGSEDVFQIAPESKDDKKGEQLSLLRAFKKPEKKRKVKLKTKVRRHIENWELPKISVLDDPPLERKKVGEKEIRLKARLLVDKLAQFNVGGKVVGIKPGPAVTMFEFKPNIDVKISKITDLADDLSLALSSESVRIIAPIPGRDVVGIETSNSHQETVYLKDIIAEDEFWDEKVRLPVPLGRAANGDPTIVDLRKMPHLMVAGTTGSGKSVFIVSFITSLLFKHSPKTLRMILVDPKQVDLAIFAKVPHLMMPPIREPKKSVVALKWAIREMEKRYASMAKFGARNIEGFNEKMAKLTKEQFAEHERINSEFEEDGRKNEMYYFEEQPLIVLVVEEFGDLMAVDKQNVEHGVVRLAQMARASGIHLVLAMQSPRKDVVTGLIKTNIPGRASFKVASKLDSRVILDESGAERLLARGDMLFLAPGVSKPARHHGAYLTEEEINRVIGFWADQGEPEYDELAMRALDGSGGGFDLDGEAGGSSSEEGYDERYDEILSWASTQKGVSASLIQRKFRLGYPRAARIIEVFEQEGVVGPPNGSKPRQVLINSYKED